MRSFIAISLPINDSLRDALLECKQLGRAVKGENIHLTLKFLGEIASAERIRVNLRSIEFKRFTITLKGMGAFPSPGKGRVLFVRAHPEDLLRRLANEVNSRTREIPLDHQFTPHITLIRSREMRDFSATISRYEETVFLDAEVTAFTLYESILRPEGPIYREIEKFQLM